MSQRDDTLTLLELRSIIATCAIENREHDRAYRICQKLIDTYGGLRTVSFDDFAKVVYKDAR